MKKQTTAGEDWRKLVFGVYALLMLTVTFIVIFVYRFVDYYLKADTGGYLLSNETLALLGIGLCGLSVWTIRRAGCARIEKALACAGWRLVAVLSVLTFLLQAFICYHTHFTSVWDMLTVVESAMAYASGEFEYFSQDYFSRCPNNLVLTVFYGSILRAVRAITHSEPGIERFMVMLILMQSVINVCVGALIWKLTRDLLQENGKAPNLCALGAWLLYFVLIGCSPWYLMPYSDSTVLGLPILMIAIYARRNGRHGIAEAVAIGLLGGLAYLIKPQAMIPAIAILLCEGVRILSRNTRRRALTYVLSLVVCAAVMAGPVKAMIVSTVDVELDPEKRLGLVHYFSMGLNPERSGQWDGREAELMTYPTNAERDAYELQLAKDRIEAYGVNGLAEHAVKKCLVNFSDGSFTWKGLMNIKHPTAEKHPVISPLLREMVYEDGRYYPILHTIQQGAWLLVLMLCAAGVLVRRRMTDGDVLCAMMLSVVGIVCFNMLFEARARYIYVMVPVMIVLAVLTLQAVVSKGLSMRRKKSAPRAEDAAAVD